MSGGSTSDYWPMIPEGPRAAKLEVALGSHSCQKVLIEEWTQNYTLNSYDLMIIPSLRVFGSSGFLWPRVDARAACLDPEGLSKRVSHVVVALRRAGQHSPHMALRIPTGRFKGSSPAPAGVQGLFVKYPIFLAPKSIPLMDFWARVLIMLALDLSRVGIPKP